jgi:hypothetical protein
MALKGRRFRRRKKEVIFVDGYYIDHANDAVPGVDAADETFHIYGVDSPETDRQHNFGTLTIGLLDKYTNNALLDVITGQDPDATTPKQYKVSDLTTVHVWANVKDERNTKYVKAWFLGSWNASLPLPSGDPNAKAQYTIAGNGDLPREFQDCWITTKKVASGGSPTLGVTPLEVPGETGVYAVAIRAIDETGGGFVQEEVTPSAAMVSSAGAITMSAIEAVLEDLTVVTDVFVYFLQSGTGVYPTVLPDKLRS